ncbi:MAG TPA: amidase [Gemmatimonadaceae bacterium]|nr:amidase [Gemmatimonadaceae bacterium]
MTRRELVGSTATELTRLVHAGAVAASDVLRQHLAHVEATDSTYGAFECLRVDDAMRDAGRLDALSPAARLALPLAGVPVAVKDNVAVAGLVTRNGSAAVTRPPAADDHPVVARLRAAGAVIVGKTRVPELALWGTSDNAFGTARSPWDPGRTAGGSSGGSGAAVAAAMVPVAHGNDGFGSIRIPAACCGLVGIKPGPGVVPAQIGVDGWYGIAENGALATTVADAALTLSVLAGDPSMAVVTPPARPLRIALAVAPPVAGLPVDGELIAHTRNVGEALAAEGHHVEEVRPPIPDPLLSLAIIGTWTSGARIEIGGLIEGDPDAWKRLERRTRMHGRVGSVARRLGLAEERHRQRWRRAMDAFLERHDVLLTPTLAQLPLHADAWRSRSWIANLVANTRYAPYCGPINFARLPAIAVPAGVHSRGAATSVHFVGRHGSERLLLGLAAVVERVRPWTRFSPRISHALAVMHDTRGAAGPD